MVLDRSRRFFGRFQRAGHLRRAPRKRHARDARRGSPESGYAYLLALLMIIVVVLSSTAAMQNMLTAGLRQREADTIWRGNQIVRAIRFYYHMTGHYPASLDDLQAGIRSADIRLDVIAGREV